MASSQWTIVLILLLTPATLAQEGVEETTQAAQSSNCYGAGSIAAAVVLTLFCTLLLVAGLLFLWKRYKQKRERHLILDAPDPEKGKEDYAFDNPGFRDAGLTPIQKQIEKSKLQSSKGRWPSWSPLSALTGKNEKRSTLDDSALDGGETKTVSLRSHDFTGLGFNICGNMREGIYIKDVLKSGPASESGKLNVGDRIKSITIAFEHMVYEDALTILSYASPYEVTVTAKSGRSVLNSGGQAAQPGHPLYRSSSIGDFMQIGNSVKKRLFQISSHGSQSSNNSSLQKSKSNATTLERNQSDSGKVALKPDRGKKAPKKLTPEQLKASLENKILETHQPFTDAAVLEVEQTQKTENKYPKFGIRVLPTEQQQKSPKLVENSENENNTNFERKPEVAKRSLDEADDYVPQVKKREKVPIKVEQTEFVRQSEPYKSSEIKRDENGIPQEMPPHMMNAALSARNRRTFTEIEPENEEVDASKNVKKQKAKAPAPPEEKSRIDSPKPSDDSNKYNSDSDAETDNQSSVNTIELNPNEITIHQTSESEKQNRKTASTGDLTKIQKIAKSGTGTLERAQSLDITDTGMPSLSKKHKTGLIEDAFDSKNNSGDSLYGNALINKEPRLSWILDGLNTFQRTKLKKSTEWGNLEDAILKLNKENDSYSDSEKGEGNNSTNDSEFDFGAKSPEFNALLNKVNEIKQETEGVTVKPKPKNQIWPFEQEEKEMVNGNRQSSPEVDLPKVNGELSKMKQVKICKASVKKDVKTTDAQEALKASSSFLEAEKVAASLDLENYSPDDMNVSDDIKVSRSSLSSLERTKGEPEQLNVQNITINSKSCDGDELSKFDISFEESKGEELLENETLDEIDKENNCTSLEITYDNEPIDSSGVSELYTTALDGTITVNKSETDKVVIKTDLIENKVSLTSFDSAENNSPNTAASENSSKNSTMTYITEIQVTPNSTATNSNVSEIEIVPEATNQNLDNKFENYVKNFETNMKKFQSQIENVDSKPTSPEPQETLTLSIDAEKELHKIQEIAEEQLKKLPEMRFTTSSYESPKQPSEKRHSQIELLRSNFEKNLPKTPKPEANTKSRIPISTSMKTPPTSPERRDSRNLEETDKELMAFMSSTVHSTPAPGSGLKYQSQPKGQQRNVTVTSIRNNSKIPSGLSNRPPVPPRKSEGNDGEENSFKQWVFNPGSSSVTNIVVAEHKGDK